MGCRQSTPATVVKDTRKAEEGNDSESGSNPRNSFPMELLGTSTDLFDDMLTPENLTEHMQIRRKRSKYNIKFKDETVLNALGDAIRGGNDEKIGELIAEDPSLLESNLSFDLSAYKVMIRIGYFE